MQKTIRLNGLTNTHNYQINFREILQTIIVHYSNNFDSMIIRVTDSIHFPNPMVIVYYRLCFFSTENEVKSLTELSS